MGAAGFRSWERTARGVDLCQTPRAIQGLCVQCSWKTPWPQLLPAQNPGVFVPRGAGRSPVPVPRGAPAGQTGDRRKELLFWGRNSFPQARPGSNPCPGPGPQRLQEPEPSVPELWRTLLWRLWSSLSISDGFVPTLRKRSGVTGWQNDLTHTEDLRNSISPGS